MVDRSEREKEKEKKKPNNKEGKKKNLPEQRRQSDPSPIFLTIQSMNKGGRSAGTEGF
jgi:hypothetical protein